MTKRRRGFFSRAGIPIVRRIEGEATATALKEMKTSNIWLFAHTPDHLRALLEGAKTYELRFAIPVADGVREFLLGPEVSEGFLARLRDAASADSWRDGFGIVQSSEDRLIGLCSFNGPPDDDGAVETSYAIAPGYTGRGYATERSEEHTSELQ